MHASSFRTVVLVSLLAGAATTMVGQDQLDKYRTQMANMGPQTPATPADGRIAATIAQWRSLQQTDALPFDSYASFLMNHPGWPGETGRRRAAERQAGSASPASVVGFFARFPPTTTSGTVAQARALAAMGRTAQANDAARTAWRMGSLASADEAAILGQFGSTLTPADHDARMDALLWQGSTSTAARQLAYVSAAKRPVFEARLALRTNAPNAADVAMNGQTIYGGDAGYIADRAVWLRNSGASPSARTWLAQSRTLSARPGDAGEYLDVLYTNARGADNDGQYQTAYDIARQIADVYPAGTDVAAQSYKERDEYTNLAWLGGQVALKHLGRPADAMVLFDRYGKGSNSPTVTSKGLYWAGRAAQAAGKTLEATQFYTAAAGYRDQFYGQLATERLGRPYSAPPAIGNPAIDPAVRAAFASREVVSAAKFLGQIGDWQDQTAFIKQIASDATTENDHVLAAELAKQLDRPDLGVMVGRSAISNGLSDYTAAGFPTVSVPAGYEDNWTLIHAISRQESQFDKTAVSHAGARGLMQLMPGTAREQSGKIGISYNAAALTTDPNLSIMLGSSYFARMYANYGSYPMAVAAYNAGPGNVNKWVRANGDPRTPGVDVVDWIEAIPIYETKNYVQRVLENAVVYDLMNPARSKSRGNNRLSWYLGKNSAG
ncbi:lytic transglycosylase domain-containing protein [Sphingomonas oligophenolica]|uniref:Lytic transglycosylase domain-containing protein n=1 Tax=Sphingomonas oligophenolica TaxID=301154 RepID=A0A502CR09_9SPHN|nr:lytic transglycosylase domain-containing protein [Sphingomonas oligophenolica]TPG14559.1 lytic transglycosylase domain-containing protein [Sphingomonas oligophenolica]